jgi:hypothetical protein
MFVCDTAALKVEVVYAGRKGHALWLLDVALLVLLLLLKLLQRLELLPLAPRHHSLDLRCRRRLLSSHLLFKPNGEPNELLARTHSRAACVGVRTCCSCFRLRVTIPDAPGDAAPAAAAAGVELVATRSPYVQPTGASLNTNTFL